MELTYSPVHSVNFYSLLKFSETCLNPILSFFFPTPRFTCVAVCLFQVREFLNKLDELVGKVSYNNDPVKAKKPALQTRTDALLNELLKRFIPLKHSLSCYVAYFLGFCLKCTDVNAFLLLKVPLWLRLSHPCLKVKDLWFCARMSSSL